MPAFAPTQTPGSEYQRDHRHAKTGRRYNASLAALFRCGAARDHFGHHPKSQEALCAELSRLAYCSFAREGAILQGALERVGFRLMTLPYDDGDTQAFLAEGTDLVVVSFRGSDDLKAWVRNLRTRPSAWEGPGRAHRGFARAVTKVYPWVNTNLSSASRRTRSKSLLLCGHSLGAALAILTAARLTRGEVYGFGAPRPGDKKFVTAIQDNSDIVYHRYVNFRDPVCHLPPRLLGYRDCGQAYHIDPKGSVTPPPPDQPTPDWKEITRLWETLEDTLRVGRSGAHSDLTDHAPINYVSALR